MARFAASGSKEGLPMVGPTDYDTIASRYAALIDERPWNALYERPTTLALLPDVGGKDVLDAGCGPGWYADWLVRRGARVEVIDLSPAMVEIAGSNPTCFDELRSSQNLFQNER
jgi:2-polyprenyl-3-methyl-5-hydroxy-6-metoxy-1,4-benzoquinol methylase